MMRKKLKIMLSLALLLVLTATTSYAFTPDFSNMTGKEIGDWISETQPHKIENGIYEKNQRSGGSGRILSQVESSMVSNYWRVIGILDTQIWWEANMSQNVTDYGVNLLEVDPIGTDVIAHANYLGGYLVTPSNARITLSGDFVEWSDVYNAYHVYNALGNGTYSFTEYGDI